MYNVYAISIFVYTSHLFKTKKFCNNFCNLILYQKHKTNMVPTLFVFSDWRFQTVFLFFTSLDILVFLVTIPDLQCRLLHLVNLLFLLIQPPLPLQKIFHISSSVMESLLTNGQIPTQQNERSDSYTTK